MSETARLQRIEPVDVLRGIIMIVMALDHTRDYFGDLAASPTNLATTTAALFATRWVTNICAPVFFLLTGTGAYLALRPPGWPVPLPVVYLVWITVVLILLSALPLVRRASATQPRVVAELPVTVRACARALPRRR